MSKLKIVVASILISIIIGAVCWWIAGEILQRWPAIASVATEPRIYRLQFGATVNKFMVIDNRLHLIVPLPVTGESGKVIEIDKVSKKARKGK